MVPGESSCPVGAENVFQKGVEGVEAKLRAAEDDPRLKKNNVNCGVRKKQARPQFSKYHFHKVLQLAIEGLSLKSLLHVFRVYKAVKS